MAKHRLEIEKNAMGGKLAYLSPVGKGGQIRMGYRIAGPKAWGGSVNLARIDIDTKELVTYIREYAPDVLDELKAES